MTQFTFYEIYKDVMEMLDDDATRGQFMKAICKFMFEEEPVKPPKQVGILLGEHYRRDDGKQGSRKERETPEKAQHEDEALHLPMLLLQGNPADDG